MRYLLIFFVFFGISCSEISNEGNFEKQIYASVLSNCLVREPDVSQITFEEFRGFEWNEVSKIVILSNSSFTTKSYEEIRQKLPQLEDETFNNFLKRNSETVALDTIIDSVELNLIFLSGTEAERIFNTALGWDNFYSKYEDSQGLLTLSRIGLNRDKTQALLYLENHSGDLSGIGYYLLLKNEGQSWQEVGVFISYLS